MPQEEPLRDPHDLAATYSELHNLLVDRTDVTDFLDQAATLVASEVLETSCGITLRRDNDVATIATSDQFAAAVDEIQYGRGQGPCLHALHTGELVSVDDLAQEERWGNYRIYAMAYGVRSSLPLTVNGDTIGALNLYSREVARFSSEAAAVCNAFAKQAATALTIVLRNADQIVLERQLREGSKPGRLSIKPSESS